VVALGRLMLASLFLVAIWVDVTQPAQAPERTFALLGAYVAFAAMIAAATWNNWWLDARLAGPAHAIDIVLSTVLVMLTEGYTSPFFIFLIFLLLAASIRWGWRETALTAILVTVLYLFAGLVALTTAHAFELYRFVIRTGQLVIVSLILIWFGMHHWRGTRGAGSDELLAEPVLDRSPLETGLAAAVAALRASSGALIWSEGAKQTIMVSRGGEISRSAPEETTRAAITPAPFLYDMAKGRSLTRDEAGNLVASAPGGLVGSDIAAGLDLGRGLSVPVRTATGEGQVFVEGMRSLSTDHIDIGQQLGVDVGAHIDRHALLRAVADSAEARSRLALARDLHDSVVQFLAGAAFRLEAMKRSEASGRQVEPELDELKTLMMHEQGELRAFITALRGGSRIGLGDLARDLAALAGRLARQWDIICDFSAEPADVMVSTDLHLDAHQLIREGVANAVRHAGAKSVRIALSAASERIRLDMINDGKAFPQHGGRIELPQSLHERVEQAGGEIELSRGMDVTKVSIMLPIAGRGL
jgi:signal transduction histidine kinase